MESDQGYNGPFLYGWGLSSMVMEGGFKVGLPQSAGKGLLKKSSNVMFL